MAEKLLRGSRGVLPAISGGSDSCRARVDHSDASEFACCK